jgi:hypothetical protein
MRAPGGVVSIHTSTKNVGSGNGRALAGRCASGGGWDFVGGGGGGGVGLVRRHATANPAIASKAKAPPIAVQDLRRVFTVVAGIDAKCVEAYNRTPTSHHREIGVLCIAREGWTAHAPFTLRSTRLLDENVGLGRIRHAGTHVESHVRRLVVG